MQYRNRKNHGAFCPLYHKRSRPGACPVDTHTTLVAWDPDCERSGFRRERVADFMGAEDVGDLHLRFAFGHERPNTSCGYFNHDFVLLSLSECDDTLWKIFCKYCICVSVCRRGDSVRRKTFSYVVPHCASIHNACQPSVYFNSMWCGYSCVI